MNYKVINCELKLPFYRVKWGGGQCYDGWSGNITAGNIFNITGLLK